MYGVKIKEKQADLMQQVEGKNRLGIKKL